MQPRRKRHGAQAYTHLRAQRGAITGRGAPQALTDATGAVTVMTLVKHAFTDGIRAHPGAEIEYR